MENSKNGSWTSPFIGNKYSAGKGLKREKLTLASGFPDAFRASKACVLLVIFDVNCCSFCLA